MIPAAHAVLDFSAASENLDRVRHFARDSRVMAVIKANGYGHGMERIARSLQGADAFAVARVDEGIRLRCAGITQRIVVLEGFTLADELGQLRKYGLEPVVHCLPQVQMIEAADAGKSLAVWLKLDTGMHRLGFYAEGFVDAYRRLTRCAIVSKPVALMTHLANADRLQDGSSERQIRLFEDLTEGLPGERSIANSAGILGWKQSHSDWVRPGIMLFGVSPFQQRTGSEFGLRPVMTLQSRLIAIKSLQPGDAVGYGSEWVADGRMPMGVVAIGYGDGYPRPSSIGMPVLVNHHRVPVIGRVSMDLITVDLRGCESVSAGDPVVLWGNGLPVEEVAREADTIPYTLLCGVTQRVRIVEEPVRAPNNETPIGVSGHHYSVES